MRDISCSAVEGEYYQWEINKPPLAFFHGVLHLGEEAERLVAAAVEAQAVEACAVEVHRRRGGEEEEEEEQEEEEEEEEEEGGGGLPNPLRGGGGGGDRGVGSPDPPRGGGGGRVTDRPGAAGRGRQRAPGAGACVWLRRRSGE